MMVGVILTDETVAKLQKLAAKKGKKMTKQDYMKVCSGIIKKAVEKADV